MKELSITSVTTHTIKLKKNKFQVVDKISADKVLFAKEKNEFLEEMLHQAQELCCGRPHISLDNEHRKEAWTSTQMCPKINKTSSHTCFACNVTARISPWTTQQARLLISTNWLT